VKKRAKFAKIPIFANLALFLIQMWGPSWLTGPNFFSLSISAVSWNRGLCPLELHSSVIAMDNAAKCPDSRSRKNFSECGPLNLWRPVRPNSLNTPTSGPRGHSVRPVWFLSGHDSGPNYHTSCRTPVQTMTSL